MFFLTDKYFSDSFFKCAEFHLRQLGTSISAEEIRQKVVQNLDIEKEFALPALPALIEDFDPTLPEGKLLKKIDPLVYL